MLIFFSSGDFSLHVTLFQSEIHGKISKDITESGNSDMFCYMFSNQIGTKHAQFFVSWSQALEKIGSVSTASLVLNKGLDMNAEPKDLLEKEKELFNDRISKKSMSQQIEALRQEVAELPSSLSSKKKSQKKKRRLDENLRLMMLNEVALSDSLGRDVSFEEWRAASILSNVSNTSSTSGSYDFLETVEVKMIETKPVVSAPSNVMPICRKIVKTLDDQPLVIPRIDDTVDQSTQIASFHAPQFF